MAHQQGYGAPQGTYPSAPGHGGTPGGAPGYGGAPGSAPGYGGTPGSAPGYGGTPGSAPGYGGTPGSAPGYGGTPGSAPGYGGTPGGAPGYGGTPGSAPGYGGTPGSAPGYGAAPSGIPGHGAAPGGAPGYGGALGSAPGYGAAPGGAPGYGTAPGGAPGYGVAPGGYPGQTNPSASQGFGQTAPVDPQIQQWFLSVDADRSGKITSQELQKALVNTNYTQFNDETCRLMIGMFDKDMSGTIDMHEFQALWHYIQQWKQTFDRFDANKSGSIEGPELQQAFQTMGYNVSPQFIQIIVVKFDHFGRRCLTLDNFIQSCVMLKSLTDAFKQRDTSLTGNVRMSYEDFMSLAILYKP